MKPLTSQTKKILLSALVVGICLMVMLVVVQLTFEITSTNGQNEFVKNTETISVKCYSGGILIYENKNSRPYERVATGLLKFTEYDTSTVKEFLVNADCVIENQRHY